MHFEAFLPLIFVVVFLLLTGVGGGGVLKQQRQTRKQMAGLARRLGLEFKRHKAKLGFEPPPTVAGPHRNRAVRFFSYTIRSGKNSTTWSAVAAAVGGAGGFSLELFPKHFLNRIAAAFGLQDIQVGDPLFDQAFVVKSNDPAYAAAALLPEIRSCLLAERTRGARGHLAITDGETRHAEVGTFNNEARVARLTRMLEVVCDLAEVAEIYKA